MDYTNLFVNDKDNIKSIINSSNFTSSKEYEKKDIFRIGKKGVKIVATKNYNSRQKFLGYSHLRIQLKPHYYFNNDLHNGNIFNHVQTIEVLQDIANKLNFKNLRLIKPTSMDYGINTIPEEYDTKDIVTQSLYAKKKPLLHPYSHLPYFKSTKRKGTNPTIGTKIYHKGIQYSDYIHSNTLRYEEIFATARKLQKEFKIYSYLDFLNLELYNNLSHHLMNSWKDVLILDEISTDYTLSNPAYYDNAWHYRNGLSNAKKDYYQQNGLWHKNLESLFFWTIEEKYKKMQIPTLIDSWKTHNEYIVGKCTATYCTVTGMDISMQREGLPYLKRAGLRHLYNSNLWLFYKIRDRFMPLEFITKSLEEQIVRIESNIRHTYDNKALCQRLMQERNYHPNQLQFNFIQ